MNESRFLCWDVEKCIVVHQSVSYQFSFAAFSPDGKTLAITSANIVSLSDPATGKETSHIAMPPGGKLIRESSDGKREPFVERHSFLAAGFTPDSKSVLTADTAGTLRVWETATGKELRQFERCLGYCSPIAFLSDGATVAAGGRNYNSICLCDVSTGRRCWPGDDRQSAIHAVAFSPDGTLLASGGDDNRVRLWNTATAKEWRTSAGMPRVMWIYICPRTARHWHPGEVIAKSVSGTLATGRAIRQIGEMKTDDSCAALSPDGAILASGGGDEPVNLSETNTGKVVRKCGAELIKATFVVFSPDGKTLASGSADNAIHLWETATGREIRRLMGHQGKVRTGTFCRDGASLITAGEDKSLRAWDVASGKEFRKLMGHGGGATVFQIVFSRDGKLLASVGDDGLICLWDAHTYRKLRPDCQEGGSLVLGLVHCLLGRWKDRRFQQWGQ